MTMDIPGIFAFSRAFSASASISVRMARSSGSFLSRGAATRCAMTVELGQRQLIAITSDNRTARILDIVFTAFSLLRKLVAHSRRIIPDNEQARHYPNYLRH